MHFILKIKLDFVFVFKLQFFGARFIQIGSVNADFQINAMKSKSLEQRQKAFFKSCDIWNFPIFPDHL